jgi:uncharacterized protein
MKNTISIIAIFFVLLFVFLKLIGPLPLSVSSVVTTKADSFTVSGEGTVDVSPDIAVVHAGVEAQGASVKAVQQELNTKMNRVTDAIKKLGIDSKDIRTANYSLNPQYDYRNATQRITGYQAHSTIIIKVRNLDKANEVIDTATTSGANNIGGVSFEIDDRTKAENDARKEAVEDARKKAELASRTAGFNLGKVINYSEDTGGVRPPMMYSAKTEMGGAADNAATQLEPGSSEVKVIVSLSYEIR